MVPAGLPRRNGVSLADLVRGLELLIVVVGADLSGERFVVKTVIPKWCYIRREIKCAKTFVERDVVTLECGREKVSLGRGGVGVVVEAANV